MYIRHYTVFDQPVLVAEEPHAVLGLTATVFILSLTGLIEAER